MYTNYSSVNLKKGSTLLLATMFCAMSTLIMSGLLGHLSQESMLLEKQVGKTQGQYIGEGALDLRRKLSTLAQTVINPATNDKYMGDVFAEQSQNTIDSYVINACGGTDNTIAVGSLDYEFNFTLGFNSQDEDHDFETATRDGDEEKLTKYKNLITRQSSVQLGDRCPPYRTSLVSYSGYKEWISSIPLFSLVAMDENIEIINNTNNLQFTGRIHSNGDIFIVGNGNDKPLIFNHESTDGTNQGEVAISAVGNIYRRAKTGFTSEFKDSAINTSDEDGAILLRGYSNAADTYSSLSDETTGDILPIPPAATPELAFDISRTNAAGDDDDRRLPQDGIYVLDSTNLNGDFDRDLDANDIDNRLLGIPGGATAHRYIQDIQHFFTYDSYLKQNSMCFQGAGTNHVYDGNTKNNISGTVIRDGVVYKGYDANVPNALNANRLEGRPLRNVASAATDGWYPSRYHPMRKKYNDLRWYGWYGMQTAGSLPTPGNPARWHFPVRSVTFIDSNDNPTDAIYGDRNAYLLPANRAGTSIKVPTIVFSGYSNDTSEVNFRDPERQAFSTAAWNPEYYSTRTAVSTATDPVTLAALKIPHFIDTHKRLDGVYRLITQDPSDYSDLRAISDALDGGPFDGFGGAAINWPHESFHMNPTGAVFNPKKTDLLRAQYVQLKKEVRRLHNAHHIYTSQIGLVQWYERLAYAGVRCPFENTDLDPADGDIGCQGGWWWRGLYDNCPICGSHGHTHVSCPVTVPNPNPLGAPIHPAGCVNCGGDGILDVPCTNAANHEPQPNLNKVKHWANDCPDCDNSGYKNGFPPHNAEYGWKRWDGVQPVDWNAEDGTVTVLKYTYPRLGTDPGAVAGVGGMYVTLNYNGYVPDCYLPNDAVRFPRAALMRGWSINSASHWPNIWGQRDGNNTYAPKPANYTSVALDPTNDHTNVNYFMDFALTNTRKDCMSFSAFWDDDNDPLTPKVELFPFNDPSFKVDVNDRTMSTYAIYKSTLPLSDRTIPMPSDYSTDPGDTSASNIYGFDYLANLWYDATGGKEPIEDKLNKPACFWRLNNYPETLKRRTAPNPNRHDAIPFHVNQFWYNSGPTGGFYGNDNLCMFNEREKKFVVFSELDMKEYTYEAMYFNYFDSWWASRGLYMINSTIGKNVLGKTVHCGAVRLKRGAQFYSNFSLATENPVYIWGDFNWPQFVHSFQAGGSTFSYTVPNTNSIVPTAGGVTDYYANSWGNTGPLGGLRHMAIFADSIDLLSNNAFPFSTITNIFTNNLPNNGPIQADNRVYFDSQLWWEDDGVRVLGNGHDNGGNIFDVDNKGTIEDFINYTRCVFGDTNDSSRYKPVIRKNNDDRGRQTPILGFASQGIRCNFFYGKVNSTTPVLFDIADINTLIKDPFISAPNNPPDLNGGGYNAPGDIPDGITNLEWYLNWIPKANRNFNSSVLTSIWDDGSYDSYIYDTEALNIGSYYGMNFTDFELDDSDAEFENFKQFFSGGDLVSSLRLHKPMSNTGTMKLHIVGSLVSLFEAYQDDSYMNPFMLSAAQYPQVYIENTARFNSPLWSVSVNYQEEGEFFAYKGSKYRADFNSFDPTESNGWGIDG